MEKNFKSAEVIPIERGKIIQLEELEKKLKIFMIKYPILSSGF